MKDQSEKPIPGQLDVYDVLADVDKRGLGAPAKRKPLTAAQIVAARLRKLGQ